MFGNKAGGVSLDYDIPDDYRICGFHGAIDATDMFLNNLGLYLKYAPVFN